MQIGLELMALPGEPIIVVAHDKESIFVRSKFKDDAVMRCILRDILIWSEHDDDIEEDDVIQYAYEAYAKRLPSQVPWEDLTHMHHRAWRDVVRALRGCPDGYARADARAERMARKDGQVRPFRKQREMDADE